MKHEYSKSKQKGIHAVKSGKERVIIDGIWSLEVPAGYSYCAEYEKTATDINGNHYRLQIQKTNTCDFSTSYGSDVNLTVRDEVIEFNNYTSDARDAKEILLQFASRMGSVEMIKEDKNILTAICESLFMPGNYSFFVIAGGRNVMEHGQITFADGTGLNEYEIAKSFIKSIEAIQIKDLATGEGLVRLPDSYLPDFDTGKYLEIDNSFRVPIPDGYKTIYDMSAQIKAAVVPENAVFTSSGVRCKLGFVMYQDPINAGTNNRIMIIDAIKKSFLEQTGINFYNWPVTTVRDTSKGTIVYSTITNTPCDQNTNPFLVVAGEKAYHCFIVITYDGPISDDCDTKWDADIITTAWLSKILFKGEKKLDKAKDNDMYEKAFPDKSLYPHYDHLMNATPKIPGSVVIVNQNGTEYAFYGLRRASASDNDGFGEEQKALFRRIVDQDTDSYDLDQDARKMASVFHVDPSVFNMKNDREAELVNGYMKRAYMFSALRSFGWTLSDYCGRIKKLPKDISIKELKSIIDFIAKRKWLNYDAGAYCKGLCSGSDLHVYYIPDSVTQDDRSGLLPSQEDYDRVSKMQSIAPTYNEILSDVQSLDSLRGSLKFLYPAVKTLYEELAKKRNYMKPLEGNEADIVYAWCALAMAAKEPFFTEDGPMTYFLSQPEHEDLLTKATGRATRDDVKGKHATPDKYTSNVDKWGFKISEIPAKQKKLIDNKTGYAVRFLPKSEVSCYVDEDMHYLQFYCFQHCPDYFDKIDELTENARKYLRLFDEDSVKDIMSGKLRNSCPIHAIRSFVWTAYEVQSDIFDSDASLDMWLDLARFIGMHGYANYLPIKKTDKHFGSALLRKEEAPTVYTEDVMQVSSNYSVEDFWQILSKATSLSLFDLIDTLIKISPVMDKYYDYLVAGNENSNESGFSSNLIMILKGWSIYALACKQPFYIVPAKRCQIDANYDDVPTWNKKAEVKEYEGGAFIAYGTSLVEIKKGCETLTIPEGITDILLCDDTRDSLREAINVAKTIIYPNSYYGTIYVGSSTVDVIAKGNIKDLSIRHINYVPYQLTEQNYRLSHIEINSVERIQQFSIPSCEGVLEFRVNEWVTELDDLAFDRAGTLKIWLPSKLSIVKDRVFIKNSDNYTTTVYVYEDCQFLPEIKKQIDSISYVNLQIMEYPWVTWARSFVNKLSLMYEKKRTNEITADGINELLSDTFGSLEKYKQSKERIITEASAKGLTGIVSIINDSADDQEAYSRLPGELCTEIRQYIEKRNLEEREKKISKIKAIIDGNSISDLSKAITIAEEIRNEDPRAIELIDKCSEKINTIKANKYEDANSLANEMTESSIQSAISIMRSISPFEDSERKLSLWQIMLENEKLYLNSVSSMTVTDIASLIRVKESFEKLGNYKDSEIKAAACERLVNEICEKKYQEARLEEKGYSKEAQIDAISKYCEIGDYKDAVDRIAVCQSNIAIIEECLELEEKLDNNKKELEFLKGLFKRRQRQEKEEQIIQIEQQIDDLKSQFASNSNES